MYNLFEDNFNVIKEIPFANDSFGLTGMNYLRFFTLQNVR